jgi:hypothetical protein
MWKTLDGNFTTHRHAKIQFAFPELSDNNNNTQRLVALPLLPQRLLRRLMYRRQ